MNSNKLNTKIDLNNCLLRIKTISYILLNTIWLQFPNI